MIALTLFLSVKVFGDDKPTRAYFVGNSVTDTIRYGSLAKLAAEPGTHPDLGAGHDPRCPAAMALGTPEGRFSGGAVWALSQGTVGIPLGRAQLAAVRPPPRRQGRRPGDGWELHRPGPEAESRSPGLRLFTLAPEGQGEGRVARPRLQDQVAEEVHRRLGRDRGDQGLLREGGCRAAEGIRGQEPSPCSWSPWATCSWNWTGG